MTAKEPTILLIQARADKDPMLEHEWICFSEQTGLSMDSIRCLNAATHSLTLSDLEGMDAVMVGGSGAFSFIKSQDDWLKRMQDFLKLLIDQRIPTFGSCFGFQGIITCLGGTLRRMDGVGEVGTFEVTLSEEGKKDPIFEGFPYTFNAQLGHNDEADILPESCINLGHSQLTKCQMIRVRNAPVFATQFHPELSRAKNFERFVRYIENYKFPGETIEEAIERSSEDYRESPESSELLKRFLKIELGYESTK